MTREIAYEAVASHILENYSNLQQCRFGHSIPYHRLYRILGLCNHISALRPIVCRSEGNPAVWEPWEDPEHSLYIWLAESVKKSFSIIQIINWNQILTETSEPHLEHLVWDYLRLKSTSTQISSF